MESKLVVDLSSGHLEVTGSEELVKFIFAEFRAEISLRSNTPRMTPLQPAQDAKPPKDGPSKRAGSRKSTGNVEVNKDLDVSGLDVFFDRYEPKTDAERALVFYKFLTEKSGTAACSIRDLYTCFFALKDKIKLPNVDSLLKNDRGRTKFFSTQDGNIMISRIGENHFSQKIKRK